MTTMLTNVDAVRQFVQQIAETAKAASVAGNADEALQTIDAFAYASIMTLNEIEEDVLVQERINVAGQVPLEEWQFNCPFDYRLARTSYLVLPKLAIKAMPPEWRLRFEAMLVEMEEAGIETPSYWVFRDDGPGERYTRARCVNEDTGFVRIVKGEEDPWANYRHGSVKELCPDYKGKHR